MSYVQIGSSRVRLDTWDDILDAVNQGLLDERSYCELKKGLPPSQNIEVARDLASFTVDGGVLIYGIGDAGDGKAGAVVGVEDPESAKRRLVGITQGTVSPSMVCEVRVIINPAEPAKGCVIVEVPPSPIAPHRADERYWGRSSEGKRVLPEPLVADLFATRRHRDDGLLDHLRSLTGPFDPVPADRRSHGHLYYTAIPAIPATTPPPWDHNKHPVELIVNAAMPRHGHGGGDLTALTHTEAHPAGIAAASFNRHDPNTEEAYAKRLLLRDTGGIDFAAGLGTRSRRITNSDSHAVVVQLAVVLIHIDQCVRLTAHLAQLHGLTGPWHLGVHMDRLLGVPPWSAVDRITIGRASTYPEETFTHDVHVTASDMIEAPQRVVEALMTPLVRGLGSLDAAFPYTDPQDFVRRNL